MNKYIVANLKNSLNDSNIEEYVSIINKINYNNLIICPNINYIKYFNGNNYFLGTQDYYEKIDYDYVIIGHYERNNTKQEVKEKLQKSINSNLKIILCIGNDDLSDYKSIKEQLDYYDIDYSKVLIAYEPYFMIGKDNNVDIQTISKCINYIKQNYDTFVLYGGNVNEKNISEILKICDGVLIGRLSFNPHKFTKVIKKIKKTF